MVVNSWRANPMLLQKLGDLDVMTVLLALEIVFYQNERLLRRAANAIKFSVGAALFDWGDVYFIDIESRKMKPRLAKKDFSPHESDVGIAMGAADSFSGADNTTNQLSFGSNL